MSKLQGIKTTLKKIAKLWRIIDHLEQIEETHKHLAFRNKRLRQRLDQCNQQIEHLKSTVASLDLKVEQLPPAPIVTQLVGLSQVFSEQMTDCHQVLIDHKHQISDINYKLELFSPVLSIHPKFSIHPPLVSAKAQLKAIAEEDNQIQQLRDIIAQLGNTAQAETLQQIPDTDLQQFLDNDSSPLPVSRDREEYGTDDQSLIYWLMGLGDYVFIKRMLQQQGRELSPGFSVLDLGCASGRVIRHFAAHESNLALYGADINQNNVTWANTYLPDHLTIFQNTVLPQLPLASNSLDLVYGCSLFTHIDDQEATWLLEIYRILKPGGMAFFTIHSERTWSQLNPDHYLFQLFTGRPHQIRELNITEVTADLFSQEMPYERIVFAATDVVINNTNVFHSIDYIKRKWGSIFKIVQVIPKAHGEHQDGILMIKEA
jgi:ubiquinone/menaquinone biosynthesis C-methylase UbiE